MTIASTDWAFASCETTPFPGTPDPARIRLKTGFDPSRLYELRYIAKDPLVLGIGFAATRDLNFFLRYGKHDAAGTPNPVAGAVRWAISEGSSQSGTFLRAFIRLGFNQDERNRVVWDESNPNIAARVLDLKRRRAAGRRCRTVRTWHRSAGVVGSLERRATRTREIGLLDRCRTTNTCPKIMETFGSAEIWTLRASFMMVGTDAKADIPLPDNVRRYYFPGVTHGGGRGGFSSVATAQQGCELPANPAPTAPMRAALMKSLVAWVTTNAAMPPSRYPTIAEGTLVPNSAALGFPMIPGRPSPANHQRPLLDYDLGPEFNCQDASGVLKAPVAVKRSLPQLAVKVDTDGNEVGGSSRRTWRRRSACTPDGT